MRQRPARKPGWLRGLTLALLAGLGAWTLLVPPLFAGVIYALFAKQTSHVAAGAYFLFGYTSALVALGGCLLLAVGSAAAAVAGRREAPQLLLVAVLVAPLALVVELGLVFLLMRQGHLFL